MSDELEREDVTDRLAALFEAHGFPVTTQQEGLLVDREGVWARATVFWLPSRSSLAQLDVWLEPWPGVGICESVAGWGSTREEALGDAFESFTRASFHVLLNAFLDPREDDPHVERTRVEIGARCYESVTSHLMMRGTRDGAHASLARRFLAELERQRFEGDAHWARFFYSQAAGETLALEVLRDNDPWPEVIDAIAREELPHDASYLSLRLFTVLLSRLLPVPRAAAIIAANADVEDGELAEMLITRGAPFDEARRLVWFVPTAFARAVLASQGARFPDVAYWYRGPEREPEPFVLLDEPLYAAAYRYAESCVANGPRSFVEALAGRSADMRAALQATRDGAPLDRLGSSVVTVFIDYDPDR